MKMGVKRLLGLAILASLALLLLTPACAPNQNGTTPPTSDNKEINSSPPPFQAPPAPELPKDWHPNLSSGLNQLVDAQKRGELESFLRQSGGAFDLVNGNVRVIIYCVPGQAEAVAKVATEAGAKQVRIRSNNRITAEVPITSLITLANEDSVTSIELPIRPAIPAQ